MYSVHVYQLRQLRTISRSLTSSATATLVHAFITSRLDYWRHSPHSTLVSLLCVWAALNRLSALPCLIGGIPRTGHVSAYMLDVLHLLPLQQRIIFRIGALLVWRFCWVSLRSTSEIFAAPPRAPEVAVHSAQ